MTQVYLKTVTVAAWREDREGARGYAVRYPDGYQSWCPAAEFERTARAFAPAEVEATLSDAGRPYVHTSISATSSGQQLPPMARHLSNEDRALVQQYAVTSSGD